MIVIADLLDAILVGCLAFGLIFSLVTILLGGIDVGDAADAGGPWFGSVSALLAAVAWFGGVGLIARNAVGLVAPLALVAAFAAGIAGAWIVGMALRRLSAEGKGLDPARYELPGTLARVSSSIRAGGVGEIIYEQEGSRQVTAARAEHGTAISRGEQVVVLAYRGGVATVAAWDELLRPRDEISPSGVVPTQIGSNSRSGRDAPVELDDERPVITTHRTG